MLQWLWVMTNTMVAFFMIHPKDAAGWFARQLERELACRWLFLEKKGVAPTNNHAERILRFGVLWRKRSQGTASEKGNRWVERILSVRQPCSCSPDRFFPHSLAPFSTTTELSLTSPESTPKVPHPVIRYI